MLFDRQVWYLAFLFASENVLAVPVSLPAVENASVELPSAIRTSAVSVDGSHATKVLSLQDNSPASSITLPSRPSSDLVYYPNDERLPSIPVASASATASPSGSSLTSPNNHELRDTFARAAQSSVRSAHEKPDSPIAVEGLESNDMALQDVPGLIPRQDASASSSAYALDSIESLFYSVYSEVTSAIASDVASSATGALTTSVSVAPASVASASVKARTTTNALDVLFSALPSDIASPLQSELNTIFPGIVGTTSDADTTQTTATNTQTNSPTNTSPTGQTTRPTGQTTRPTGTRTRRPMTNTHPTNTHTYPTTRPTHHTTLHTSQTSTTSPTTTGTNTLAPGQATGGPKGNPEAEIGAHPISNAAVAGIASGLAAGFVVAGLAGLYIFRRRKQGKPVFGGLGRGGSKRSTGSGPYPAVAWLYDPKMSPPNGNSRSGSVADGAEERLIPERPGSRGPVEDSAPEIAPVRPSSPLLAPHMPPARDRSLSPNRSRDRRSASIDASQGLLRPVSQE